MAASVTGAKHQRQGQANQDACCISSRRDGVLCLVAADGAGSAQCAEVGSSLAVQAATSFLAKVTLPTCQDDWQTLFLDALEHVRAQMETWLQTENNHLQPETTYTLQDLSTTLLIAVVTETQVAAVQVGDGGIVAVTQDDEPYFVTEPYHGEYVGETIFVTSPHYEDHISITVLAKDDVCGLALMTDGLEPVAIQQSTQEHQNQEHQNQEHQQQEQNAPASPFANFFQPMFKFAANPTQNAAIKSQQLADFLASDRMSSRSDDDKTLILASWDCR